MNNLKIVSVYAMLSVAPALVYAQGKITGQVTNKSNEPILGASVIVEGERLEPPQTSRVNLN